MAEPSAKRRRGQRLPAPTPLSISALPDHIIGRIVRFVPQSMVWKIRNIQQINKKWQAILFRFCSPFALNSTTLAVHLAIDYGGIGCNGAVGLLPPVWVLDQSNNPMFKVKSSTFGRFLMRSLPASRGLKLTVTKKGYRIGTCPDNELVNQLLVHFKDRKLTELELHADYDILDVDMAKLKSVILSNKGTLLTITGAILAEKSFQLVPTLQKCTSLNVLHLSTDHSISAKSLSKMIELLESKKEQWNELSVKLSHQLHENELSTLTRLIQAAVACDQAKVHVTIDSHNLSNEFLLNDQETLNPFYAAVNQAQDLRIDLNWEKSFGHFKGEYDATQEVDWATLCKACPNPNITLHVPDCLVRWNGYNLGLLRQIFVLANIQPAITIMIDLRADHDSTVGGWVQTLRELRDDDVHSFEHDLVFALSTDSKPTIEVSIQYQSDDGELLQAKTIKPHFRRVACSVKLESLTIQCPEQIRRELEMEFIDVLP